MSLLIENIWPLITMLLLIFASGFFSGSETAFLNLSHRQTTAFRKSEHRLHRLAANLSKNSKHLLTSLLFGNMLVNILYFSISSAMSLRLAKDSGPVAATTAAVVAFLFLLFFGEMFPKSLAYSNSTRFSIIAAAPAYILTRLFLPVRVVLNTLIVVPAIRLIAPTRKKDASITAKQLKSLIDFGNQQTPAKTNENQLLNAIIEFGFLKTRHVMRSRVDMISCKCSTSSEQAKNLMKENRTKRLPVFAGKIDNIIGIVYLEDLILNPNHKIKDLLRNVDFVPEQASAESLLNFFIDNNKDIAIVVDEFGQISGVVSLENIFDELLGPAETFNGSETIKVIGPLKYQLAGNLSVHNWAEAFGLDPSQFHLTTISGLTTALLGKIPVPGDVAYFKNLKFTVEKVEKYRIKTLILSLEPISDK